MNQKAFVSHGFARINTDKTRQQYGLAFRHPCQSVFIRGSIALSRMVQSGVLAVSCLAMLLPAPASAAQEIKPFVRGSYQHIVAARQGRPFMVNFWSLTCNYCMVEMAMLKKLVKKYPKLNLVLVSTDTPEEEKEIAATLAKFSLGKAEAWVFADDYSERLRFEVDRKWQGELPRTYFFSPGKEAAGISGKLEYKEVEQWVKEQYAVK